MDSVHAHARQLAQTYLRDGDFASWFDALYSAARGDAGMIPWADLSVNRNLLDWLERGDLPRPEGRALVVGCGLGDDAEELARRGLLVTAFDISPTAIDWCRRRFPDSVVQYTCADLLNPPADWSGAFDFVLEAYTLQSLPADVRQRAMRNLAMFVSPGGCILVICRGRDPGPEDAGPPWPLDRADLDRLTAAGLTEASFEDYFEAKEPAVRRFRALYRREPCATAAVSVSPGSQRRHSSVEIRPMEDADVDRVAALLRACFRWLGDREGFSPRQRAFLEGPRSSPETVRQEAKSRPHLVACEDGAVVGLVVVNGQEIARLYVHPDFHRRGIGTRLFEAATDLIRRSGGTEVRVGALVADAVAFYRAMGMSIVGKEAYEPAIFGGRKVTLLRRLL